MITPIKIPVHDNKSFSLTAMKANAIQENYVYMTADHAIQENYV